MSERDWADAEFVRIYQTVRDDPKFAKVFADDRAFAAYVRLLMDAEPMWPRRASLPAHLSRYARDVLVRAGILVIEGLTYTLSGLDKEREHRKKRYGDGTGRPRYDSDKAPKSLREISDSVEEEIPTSEATRARVSDSSSSSEVSLEGGAGGNLDDIDGPMAYYLVTTRYPEHHTELHAWVTTLANGYGADTFQAALATEYRANHHLKDLVSRTESRLAMEADRKHRANPIKFDRQAWIEQKRREQEARYDAQGGAA